MFRPIPFCGNLSAAAFSNIRKLSFDFRRSEKFFDIQKKDFRNRESKADYEKNDQIIIEIQFQDLNGDCFFQQQINYDVNESVKHGSDETENDVFHIFGQS